MTTSNIVTPVDVLIGMGLLTRDLLEDWRRGRVHYLERVITCNLSRLSRLLRILRFHAHDLNLAPSISEYKRFGKGPKQRLRFTKTGEPRLEEAYCRHFVRLGKAPPGMQPKKVKHLLTEYVRLHNDGVSSRDFTQMLELFAEDAEFHFLNIPFGPMIGKEAIEKAFLDHPPTDHLVLRDIRSVSANVIRAQHGWKSSDAAGTLQLWRAVQKIQKLVVG